MTKTYTINGEEYGECSKNDSTTIFVDNINGIDKIIYLRKVKNIVNLQKINEKMKELEEMGAFK